MAKTTIHPKKLFATDCLGALLTAVVTGIVLVQFESVFGMPRNSLYFLSGLACLFALYSFLGYFYFSAIGLKIIAFANLIYCGITIFFLFYYRGLLTLAGVGYFLVEIMVIICLVYVELKSAAAAGTNTTQP